MFGISHGPELLILVVIALVIFGPKRIPEIGSSLGKGIREFKKSTQDDDPTEAQAPARQIANPAPPADVRVPETAARSDSETR